MLHGTPQLSELTTEKMSAADADNGQKIIDNTEAVNSSRESGENEVAGPKPTKSIEDHASEPHSQNHTSGETDHRSASIRYSGSLVVPIFILVWASGWLPSLIY